MPDRRKHRGPHPEDSRLFEAEVQRGLRQAANDFCWLLDRGYPHDSSLKLVGDRYELVARQRTAVSRCCCSRSQASRRRGCRVEAERLAGAALWIDGYNVLTTIEAALAGGVILAARDGAYRDMASMHGSYRKVAETLPALELLGREIAALGVAECRWLFDQPVSNSGRLKRLIEDAAAASCWSWRAEVVPDPDVVLADCTANHLGVARGKVPAQRNIVVATADSAVLDRCPPWFNLAQTTIAHHVPDAWVVELFEAAMK
jgi:hypothetical protein